MEQLSRNAEAHLADSKAQEECPPKTADELLKRASSDFYRQEANKVSVLKGELEAYKKKRDKLIEEYKAAYPKLLDQWEVQNGEVEKLEVLIKAAFPDAERRELVEKRICPKLVALKKYLIDKIVESRSAMRGDLGSKADAAAEQVAVAKEGLDALLENARRIPTDIATVDKLCGEIRDLLGNPDQVIAIYLFWFKLLPLHRAIRPEAKVPGSGAPELDTPSKLCPTGGDLFEIDRERRARLVEEAQYSRVLDAAWVKYGTARQKFADAEAAFKADPDDLPSLEKQCDDAKKALDAEIRNELLKPEEPPAPPPPPPPPASAARALPD